MHRLIAPLAIAAFVLTAGTAGAAQTPARSPTARATPGHSYVVRAGEGWSQIASSHGVTMQQLLTANHATTSTHVAAGQKINLPPAAKSKAKAAPAPKRG